LNFYRLTVEYKGTNYQGFQIQPNFPTIQGELNNALKIICKSEEIKTIGSGRTDAGVHAIAQIVRAEIPLEINSLNLLRAINTKLPRDIRIIKVEPTDEKFHPIYSAKFKEYNYVFTTREIHSVFARELMTQFDYDFDEELMRLACLKFIGKYDFKNYQCTGTEIENTVREISLCELQKFKSEGFWSNCVEEYYVIRVVGNGFLKQMVRLMVGAIWNVARGKISLEILEKSLFEISKDRLGATAPPEGLYLKEVSY
jgi:tRNA pseudouridine38-40 synthase